MKALTGLSAIALLLLAATPALAQEYGSVTGIVTSAGNTAVPGATVTLWDISCGEPVLADVPNNPQYTSDFSTSLPGAYAFTGVPNGMYNVTAMWNDYWYYTTVEVKGGTATANVVIPERINITAFASPTPVPTPVSYYTYVPLQVASPLPQVTTRSPGFESLIALLALPAAALARKRLRG